MSQADIGVAGLAVMGENLAVNMMNHGFKVAVYNRTMEKVDAFVANRCKGLPVVPAQSVKGFVESLSSPRKIFMMVKAGAAVDASIDAFLPYLSPGDILIDGGNSNYQDTRRRYTALAEKGIRYIGCGVSGGEEGALNGPALMPGGDYSAWPLVEPILSAISAKAHDGAPCCAWTGSDGAGHFVKMVHNGIEYGDMQILCESWQLMRSSLGMDIPASAETFSKWNKGRLESYLVSITADILAYKDEDGTFLVDAIMDTAGQKGTGKWTVINSLDFAVSTSLIAEAVFARIVSANRTLRDHAAALFPKAANRVGAGVTISIDDLEAAVFTAKVISYAQGFQLLSAANKEFDWKMDMGSIASIWRGGCIIRSAFLDRIMAAYDSNAGLEHLLFDEYFASVIQSGHGALRRVCAHAALAEIPVPSLSGALSWLDAFRSERLPANLLQAQRDYFGAHGYERTDRPRGEVFHTNWTGHGGSTAASSYTV